MEAIIIIIIIIIINFKSQSYISIYKPTPLPPQLFLCHLYPSSTLSLLPPYTKSTIYSLNHRIHIVISILFLPLY